MVKEFKIGKYYLLDLSKEYFIPALQTHIRFTSPVAIKLTNFVLGKPAFGKLVILYAGGEGDDLEVNEDVELNENCLTSEYKLNSGTHLLFYMDFPYDFTKKSQLISNK